MTGAMKAQQETSPKSSESSCRKDFVCYLNEAAKRSPAVSTLRMMGRYVYLLHVVEFDEGERCQICFLAPLLSIRLLFHSYQFFVRG
jgi:hypothetical protein